MLVELSAPLDSKLEALGMSDDFVPGQGARVGQAERELQEELASVSAAVAAASDRVLDEDSMTKEAGTSESSEGGPTGAETNRQF